ncbi:hypothetical protein CEXT_544531 [Caerostris extrusa]|uniref:Uncharacterized protein n=1 Tax=Caerostris extrusa TaxID=172846 RepID=A0AAV4MYG9_CAEEX|nr:hypothetical protein CEXT_544531 [Caerostris extrusa]
MDPDFQFMNGSARSLRTAGVVSHFNILLKGHLPAILKPNRLPARKAHFENGKLFWSSNDEQSQPLIAS